MSLLGKLAGGFLANRAAKKARARALDDELQKYKRLRASAKLGRINMLTALGAGGANSLSTLPSGRAPLASQEVLLGSISAVDNYITGVRQNKKARSEAGEEWRAVQEEKKYAGGGGPIAQRTQKVGRVGNMTYTDAPIGKSPVETLVETKPVGEMQVSNTGEITDRMELQVEYVDEKGNIGKQYVGPDIDELISGAVIALQINVDDPNTKDTNARVLQWVLSALKPNRNNERMGYVVSQETIDSIKRRIKRPIPRPHVSPSKSREIFRGRLLQPMKGLLQ